MFLWRITNHITLDGRGGLLASARWHTQGRPVVYLAETPAGALLEVMVHLELREQGWPTNYKLLKVRIPREVSRERVRQAGLPHNWTQALAATRTIGDQWLVERRTALLAVPSAVVPETENWLLNPAHAEARNVSVESSLSFAFDRRLVRMTLP